MKAVIFDFDGVVVDSEKHWDPCIEELAPKLCPGWRAGDNARLLTGRNAHECWMLMTKELGMTIDERTFMEHLTNITDVIYGQKTVLLPGVKALLDSLNANDIPVGLATSSQRAWIDAGLHRLHIHASFQTIATGDEVGSGKGKPAPDLYLLAANRLNVLPAECIAIEDSTNGVRSAKTAGMTCVGLRNGFNTSQDLSAADIVVEGFDIVNIAFLQRLA